VSLLSNHSFCIVDLIEGEWVIYSISKTRKFKLQTRQKILMTSESQLNQKKSTLCKLKITTILASNSKWVKVQTPPKRLEKRTNNLNASSQALTVRRQSQKSLPCAGPNLARVHSRNFLLALDQSRSSVKPWLQKTKIPVQASLTENKLKLCHFIPQSMKTSSRYAGSEFLSFRQDD